MDTSTILKLMSDNEQDRAECDSWMEAHTEEQLVTVLSRIIKQCDDEDQLTAIVGRFAQLAFGEVMERKFRQMPEVELDGKDAAEAFRAWIKTPDGFAVARDLSRASRDCANVGDIMRRIYAAGWTDRGAQSNA